MMCFMRFESDHCEGLSSLDIRLLLCLALTAAISRVISQLLLRPQNGLLAGGAVSLLFSSGANHHDRNKRKLLFLQSLIAH